MLGVKVWPIRSWKLKYWLRVARPDWLVEHKLRRGDHMHDLKFFRADPEWDSCDSCNYEYQDRWPHIGRRMVGHMSGYYEPEWEQHCVRCLHRQTEFWECQPEEDLKAWANECLREKS